MGKGQIAQQGHYERKNETEQHHEANPERQHAILEQDDRQREGEAAICFSVSDLAQFAPGRRMPGDVSIEDISGDATQKDSQSQA